MSDDPNARLASELACRPSGAFRTGHRHCSWCASSTGMSVACTCDRDCGGSACPMGLDVYVPPPVPRFREETP